MAILVDENSRVLVQGITGREGAFHTARMRAAGTNVVAGVSPGKGGLGTFAPPLDAAGNSVKGQLVARRLARELALEVFAADPA